MRKLTRTALCLALVAPLVAGAAEVEVAVDAGVGYSDNIARTTTDEREETIAQAGLRLSVQQDTRRLAVDLTADVAYQEYLRNTYDGEVVGNVEGTAVLRLVPDRIHWNFEDNFGQTRLDLFAPVTPANRENVNYFSTGPDVMLRLGAGNELRLGARYARADYEVSLLDSQQYSGSVGVARKISEAAELSLNAQTQRVEYADSPPNVDFRRDAAFARYAAEAGRVKLSIDAGINRVDRSGAKDDGALFRLELRRQISDLSALTLTAGREFTDSGSSLGGFGSLVGASATGTQSLSRTGDPYTSTYASLGWDARGRRTRVGISAGYFDESYEQSVALDRDRIVGQAYVARDFASAWTARLSVNYARDDFQNSAGDFSELSAVVGLSRQATRRLYVDLSVERYDRNLSGSADGYTENRAWLRLRFGDATVRTRDRAYPVERADNVTQ